MTSNARLNWIYECQFSPALMTKYALVLPVVFGAAMVSAQQAPPQEPAGQQPAVTFRTETNFVEVHAIVTDQNLSGFRLICP